MKILYETVLYCVTKEKNYCATNHSSRDRYLILTIKVLPILWILWKKPLFSTYFIFGSYWARYVEIYRGEGVGENAYNKAGEVNEKQSRLRVTFEQITEIEEE